MHLPKAWWGFLRAECMAPHMHTHGFRSLRMASDWGYIQEGSQRAGVRSENQMENSKEGPQGHPEKTGRGSELVFPVLTGSCEQLPALGARHWSANAAPSSGPRAAKMIGKNSTRELVCVAPSSSNTAFTSTTRGRVAPASRTKKIRSLPGREAICPNRLTLWTLELFRDSSLKKHTSVKSSWCKEARRRV